VSTPEWITYSRRHHATDELTSFTRPVGERVAGHYDTRAATAEEIAEELKRRRNAEEEKSNTKLFNERPEVKDARAIGGYIEHNLERVIDAFTPAQWRKFRHALDTKYITNFRL
jgi:hypothetical protein